MSKKNKEKAVAPDMPAKAPKPRAPGKPVRSKAKAKEGGDSGFDFVGKVESIVVSGEREDGVFEFGLRGRHGARQTFRLRTSDSIALALMAPIVTAAHATESKIGVRVATSDAGTPCVVEVASRPKLGKPA